MGALRVTSHGLFEHGIRSTPTTSNRRDIPCMRISATHQLPDSSAALRSRLEGDGSPQLRMMLRGCATSAHVSQKPKNDVLLPRKRGESHGWCLSSTCGVCKRHIQARTELQWVVTRSSCILDAKLVGYASSGVHGLRLSVHQGNDGAATPQPCCASSTS